MEWLCSLKNLYFIFLLLVLCEEIRYTLGKDDNEEDEFFRYDPRDNDDFLPDYSSDEPTYKRMYRVNSPVYHRYEHIPIRIYYPVHIPQYIYEKKRYEFPKFNYSSVKAESPKFQSQPQPKPKPKAQPKAKPKSQPKPKPKTHMTIIESKNDKKKVNRPLRTRPIPFRDLDPEFATPVPRPPISARPSRKIQHTSTLKPFVAAIYKKSIIKEASARPVVDRVKSPNKSTERQIPRKKIYREVQYTIRERPKNRNNREEVIETHFTHQPQDRRPYPGNQYQQDVVPNRKPRMQHESEKYEEQWQRPRRKGKLENNPRIGNQNHQQNIHRHEIPAKEHFKNVPGSLTALVNEPDTFLREVEPTFVERPNGTKSEKRKEVIRETEEDYDSSEEDYEEPPPPPPRKVTKITKTKVYFDDSAEKQPEQQPKSIYHKPQEDQPQQEPRNVYRKSQEQLHQEPKTKYVYRRPQEQLHQEPKTKYVYRRPQEQLHQEPKTKYVYRKPQEQLHQEPKTKQIYQRPQEQQEPRIKPKYIYRPQDQQYPPRQQERYNIRNDYPYTDYQQIPLVKRNRSQYQNSRSHQKNEELKQRSQKKQPYREEVQYITEYEKPREKIVRTSDDSRSQNSPDQDSFEEVYKVSSVEYPDYSEGFKHEPTQRIKSRPKRFTTRPLAERVSLSSANPALVKIFKAIHLEDSDEDVILVDKRIIRDEKGNPTRILTKTISLKKDPNPDPSCAVEGNSYCTEDEDYPKEEIIKAIKNDSKPLSSVLNIKPELGEVGKLKIIQEGDIASNCSSRKSLISPLRAKDVDGIWRIVVNVEDLQQSIQLDVCRSPLCSKEGSPNSICTQHQAERHLLTYSSVKGLSVKTFKFPSSCSCFNRR